MPGGHALRVSFENCLQYCDLALQRRLEESVVQIDAIRAGLFSIVPPAAVALFTPSQLEQLVCGCVEVDVDLLRSLTVYVPCVLRCVVVVRCVALCCVVLRCVALCCVALLGKGDNAGCPVTHASHHTGTKAA